MPTLAFDVLCKRTSDLRQGLPDCPEPVRRERLPRAHGIRRFEVPASRECGQTLEQSLFVSIQQRVTPVQRGSQRLVSWRVEPTTARQQAEPVRQQFRNLRHTERRHTHRGQFDRERDALQPDAIRG